jgi:hypothetical protein
VLGIWANFMGTFGIHAEKLKMKIGGMAVCLAGWLAPSSPKLISLCHLQVESGVGYYH